MKLFSLFIFISLYHLVNLFPIQIKEHVLDSLKIVMEYVMTPIKRLHFLVFIFTIQEITD